MKYKRGDIIWVRIAQGNGSVQKGVNRPCIIISNNIGNKHGNTLIVVLLTKVFKNKLPIHLSIKTTFENGLGYDSVIMAEQIQTISIIQVVEKTGELEKKYINEFNNIIKISLGL